MGSFYEMPPHNYYTYVWSDIICHLIIVVVAVKYDPVPFPVKDLLVVN